MPKKTFIGVVTSAAMPKTRRVEITRRVKHPVYGKFIRRRTVCSVHDADNASSMGDTVEIIESRPMSKTKRWQLVKVIQSHQMLDVTRHRESTEEAEVREVLDQSHAKPASPSA